MTLEDLLTVGLNPAMSLLPTKLDRVEARVLLLAICGQEAGFGARVQRVAGGRRGPAMGLLQFERGGGVKGVMEHPISRPYAQRACTRLGVEFMAAEVWRALEFSDALAFTFGRLLLYTDLAPLPRVGEVDAAWDYYLRNWRPGKPHRNAWKKNYLLASDFITGETP